MNAFEFCIQGIANVRCLITQMILWPSARGARNGNWLCYSFVPRWHSFCVISVLFDTDIVRAWKPALTRRSVLVKSSIAWRSFLFFYFQKEMKNVFIKSKVLSFFF